MSGKSLTENDVAELAGMLGVLQSGTADASQIARMAEIMARSGSQAPPLNVAKTRKLLASFGAADHIAPADMDELLSLCGKEMYMMPLFEHLQVPQYCLKVYATHRNEAVREMALYALGEFWQNNNTRSKVMASLDVLPFVFSVLDDPKAPLAFKVQASRALMFVDSDLLTLLATHCEKHPLALASIPPLLSDKIVQVRTCCSAQKLAKLRFIGMGGETSSELGTNALSFLKLSLANAPPEMLRMHPMFAPLRDPAAGIAERLLQLGAGNRPFNQRCRAFSCEWICVMQAGVALPSSVAVTASLEAGADPYRAQRLHHLNFDANVLKCGHCGREDTKLSKCSRCERERYCGASCQRAHWKAHKPVCVPKPE